VNYSEAEDPDIIAEDGRAKNPICNLFQAWVSWVTCGGAHATSFPGSIHRPVSLLFADLSSRLGSHVAQVRSEESVVAIPGRACDGRKRAKELISANLRESLSRDLRGMLAVGRHFARAFRRLAIAAPGLLARVKGHGLRRCGFRAEMHALAACRSKHFRSAYTRLRASPGAWAATRSSFES